MKKLTKISKILLLVVAALTMTQCRKAIEPVYQIPNNNGEKVLFTLTADNGSKGTRTEITQNGNILNVTWSAGDVIYVAGSEQGYLGSLTIQSGYGTVSATFSGEITPISKTQTIRVYYLGKSERDIDDNATTINIGAQAGTLDDIEKYHIASAGIADVAAGTTSLTGVELETKLAIVKFDLTGFGTGTKLYGSEIFKEININLKNGSLTGSGLATASDSIAITNPTNATYLALLPTTTTTTITIKDNYITDTYTDKTLSENTFYSISGDGITPIPKGAVRGLFTVDYSGKQVYFSKGNLQYQASTNTWRFAENQWFAYGTGGGNSTPIVNEYGDSLRSVQDEWIDFFGWGTSGYEGTDTYPWSIEDTDKYGPTSGNLTGVNNIYDWGQNAISNGGTPTNPWRTLSADEWTYLISNNRVCLAMIDETNNCLILLPDGLESDLITTIDTPDDSPQYSDNELSTDVALDLTNQGGVILTDAGYRDAYYIEHNDQYGFYWTSTRGVFDDGDPYDGGNVFCFSVSDSIGLNFFGTSGIENFFFAGYSVRLVQDK